MAGHSKILGTAAVLVSGVVGAMLLGRGDRARPQRGNSEREVEPVLLLAAASTTDAVTELAAAFETKTGIRVNITTGGSNALANQILAGVPGEVFLSANMKWAQTVERNELAIETMPLLSNRLVIVAPRGNPAGVKSPGELLSDKVRHIALAGDEVPAGLYAEQALRHARVYDELIARNRVARGQNVRLALSYVETGEAEAGVVYATDARASDKVEVVYTFPPESHDAINYPLVLLKSPGNQVAGRRLFDFLRSADAMAVFEKHGFSASATKGGN